MSAIRNQPALPRFEKSFGVARFKPKLNFTEKIGGEQYVRAQPECAAFNYRAVGRKRTNINGFAGNRRMREASGKTEIVSVFSLAASGQCVRADLARLSWRAETRHDLVF